MTTPEPLSDEDLRCIRAHMDHVHKCNCAYCEPYRDTLRLLDEHARLKARDERVRDAMAEELRKCDRRYYGNDEGEAYTGLINALEVALQGLSPDASTTETKR